MTIIESAYWADCAWHPRGWCLCYLTADLSAVVLVINGLETARVAVPTSLQYLRCVSNDAGDVQFAGQAQDSGIIRGEFSASGAAHSWRDGTPCYDSPGLLWNAAEGFVLFSLLNTTTYRRRTQDLPTPFETPRSWLQVAVDGVESLQWEITNHVRTIGGTTVIEGVWANGYCFGQGSGNGMIGASETQPPVQAMPTTFQPYAPRACYDTVHSQYVVCSVDLRGPVVGWNVSPFPPAEQPSEPMPKVDEIVPCAPEFAAGGYIFIDGYSSAHRNIEILIRPSDAAIARAVASKARLVVTEGDLPRVPRERVWKLWCSGNADECAANMDALRVHGLPLFVVPDVDPHPVPQSVLDHLRTGDVLAPEFNRGKQESRALFRQRIGRETERLQVTLRLKQVQFIPSCGCYDRGFLTENEMAEAIIGCSTISDDYGTWHGAVLFTLAGRSATLPDGTVSGGLDVHPNIVPYVDRWFAPALPYDPPPPAIDLGRRRRGMVL